MNDIWIIILISVAAFAFLYMLLRFIVRLKKYDFIGNIAFYIIVSYLVCLMFALAANFNPIKIEVVDGVKTVIHTFENERQNIAAAVAMSLFDALRMMAVAFDQSRIDAYGQSPELMHRVFAYAYALASIFALIFASITTVLSLLKTFKARLQNLNRLRKRDTEIYYIFSDPKVTIALKLAKELKKNNKVVVMLLTRSSQKTQEGTEYKDMLVSNGLVVKTESFSQGIAKFIFNKHFNKQYHPLAKLFGYDKRRVFVYGLFSDDETSVELGNNFKEAIVNNKHFIDLKTKLKNKTIKSKDFDKFRKIRVFLTYHATDFDTESGYSAETCQIVSTLSEYDMISSEFVLNNQLSNFVSMKEIGQNEDNKNFNVTFLGFGNINRPIFEKMSYAYQLWGDNVNKVNYHILDRRSETLVTPYENDFTKEVKPKKGESQKDHVLLYRIDAEGDGQDLTSYEFVKSYVQKIKDNKGKKYTNRFQPDGFEVFVVSICDTTTDIRIALLLRKAILSIFDQQKDKERIKKTVIFVRVGNESIWKQFCATHSSEVVSQEQLNDGYLFEKDHVDVPIVIFGENALMSKYISDHLRTIMRLGLASEIAYQTENNPKDGSVDPVYKAQIEWFKKTKDKVSKNTSTVYSLKTKLNLLGYKLTSDYKIARLDGKQVQPNEIVDVMNKTTFPVFDLNNDIIKLAELEHNRWMATEYLLFKSTVWEMDEFLKNCIDYEYKEINTRSPDKTKHSCMVTNEKLHEMRSKLLKIKEPEWFQDKVEKLTYYNDINMIQKMFETLEVVKVKEADNKVEEKKPRQKSKK